MKPTSLAHAAACVLFAVGAATPVLAQQSGNEHGHGLPDGTLAIVNGVSIPQTRLTDAMRAAHQADTPEMRRLFKQELIAREVLRQNAEKQRYDTRPAVQEAVMASKAAAETELYLRDNIRPQPINDAQVKARYDAIVSSMGEEEYKLRILSVADDASAAKVLERLKGGEAFDRLVREYSIASSQEDNGAMPWVSFKTPAVEGKTQGVPLPIAKAIPRVPVGGYTTEPIALDNVRVIVKVEGRRPAHAPGFEQMKDAIRAQLQVAALKSASAGFIAAQVRSAKIRE